MQIRLVLPTMADQDNLCDYRQSFDYHNQEMAGSAGLDENIPFQMWYQRLVDNLTSKTVHDGLVPATTFLALNENDEVVGMIDIRHKLNDYLLQLGGHIGYSVKPTFQRKGIATQMLALALDECRLFGFDRVLITCDKENIGSAKTIQKNNGILENEVVSENRITQRYWITL